MRPLNGSHGEEPNFWTGEKKWEKDGKDGGKEREKKWEGKIEGREKLELLLQEYLNKPIGNSCFIYLMIALT